MENVVGWIVILGALYLFVPSFRRMVNGWIVQLGDKVKDDAELPIKKEAPDEKLVEETALMMFRMQFPDNPDKDKGFDGVSEEGRNAIRSYYINRARAYLSGEDMDEYDAALKNGAI
ncbi:hypothetical protein HB770_04175 [Rhizobium leguminosarum bv. viciae]|uniref:Transmembrane protein n=1 Tax=Rhizobium leguminosarum bv. viciae TaxID=387 RepID=A0A7G6RHW1_RHILV|nr:hypothetical protein HB770_04175 [Rhizobium leguminosarum bv. viciae]